MSVLPRHLHLLSSCLWGDVSSSLLGIGMGPIPSLTFAID